MNAFSSVPADSAVSSRFFHSRTNFAEVSSGVSTSTLLRNLIGINNIPGSFGLRATVKRIPSRIWVICFMNSSDCQYRSFNNKSFLALHVRDVKRIDDVHDALDSGRLAGQQQSVFPRVRWLA